VRFRLTGCLNANLKCLRLALDLTPPLPLTAGVLDKWLAEPTRQIFLPASTFIANAKSYPVLPKGTQSFIRDIMKVSTYTRTPVVLSVVEYFLQLQPTIIISGTNTGQHSRGGERAYSQYIRHLEKTSPGVQAMQKLGTVENFSIGYQDYLQAPLQVCNHHLCAVRGL
jgi:protein arginine N-methyltransferase 5